MIGLGVGFCMIVWEVKLFLELASSISEIWLFAVVSEPDASDSEMLDMMAVGGGDVSIEVGGIGV